YLVGRPPIRADRGNCDVFRQRHNQIGFADGPSVIIGKDPWGRRVLRIPLDGTAIDPRGDRADFPIREAAIVLEVLHAHVLLDIPGRHLPTGDTVLDRACPRSYILELGQRHGSDGARAMTLLARTLKD